MYTPIVKPKQNTHIVDTSSPKLFLGSVENTSVLVEAKCLQLLNWKL